MLLLHTDASSDTTSPAPPLPEGRHYTEELRRDDVFAAFRRSKLTLPVFVAVLVVVSVIGLVVLNAAMHYSRGVAALNDQSYAAAAAEFSAAKLLIFRYRDAEVLADRARRDLAAQTAAQANAQARVDLVSGALDDAAGRLIAGDAPGVLAALRSLHPGDVRAAFRASADARATAGTLTLGLTTAAKEALRELKWGRAGRYAAALLVLDPSAQEAAGLAGKARTGAELSARLAKAEDAARHGRWRTALRLALAVTAVREGFPGAAAVIAHARAALAPKPKPVSKKAATAAPAPAATPAPTSAPQPPPP